MIPLLKNLLYDPSSFSNFIRGAVFALGELPSLVNFGELGGPAYYVGKGLQVLALLIRHGEVNKTP